MALDLSYLLTFYGNENQLEAQRLLGSVASALDSRPQLTRRMILDTISDPTFHSYLSDADLADQVERVRLLPQPLSLEEVSKLWTIFQTPYRLSIAYQATVVLIEAPGTPRAVLPVQELRVLATPFAPPVVTAVEPPLVVAGPDARLTLRGANLGGSGLTVRFGAQEVTPASAAEDRLTVAVPAGLTAGVNTVQIATHWDLGAPSGLHSGGESNAVAFVLQPQISKVTFAAHDPATGGSVPTVQVDLTPAVGPQQEVTLLLNEWQPVGHAPRAFSFPVPSRPAAQTTLHIPVPGAASGTYLVRVRVDRADSPLTTDTAPASATFRQYNGPQVMIP